MLERSAERMVTSEDGRSLISKKHVEIVLTGRGRELALIEVWIGATDCCCWWTDLRLHLQSLSQQLGFQVLNRQQSTISITTQGKKTKQIFSGVTGEKKLDAAENYDFPRLQISNKIPTDSRKLPTEKTMGVQNLSLSFEFPKIGAQILHFLDKNFETSRFLDNFLTAEKFKGNWQPLTPAMMPLETIL